MGILIEENYVNETEGHRLGDSGVYESWCETPGDVFRAMQQEYGKCVGMHVGWVFEKLQKYTDCDKTYLMQTWITLHESKPVKSITYDYMEM